MVLSALIAGIAGLFGLSSALPASARMAEAGFLDRTVTVAGKPHPYKVYVPAGYEPGRRLPVILFLHGSGERGSDNIAQTRVGLGPILERDPARYPAIVVFPQAPLDARWAGSASAIALAALGEIEREFYTDPDRVYLTGMSMGGSGAWYIAYRQPERFAALAIVCARIIPADERNAPIAPSQNGNVYASIAERLDDVPIWIFHGDADDIVPVGESREMFEALRAAGSSARYTELAGVNHNSWDPAYASPELAEWLFAHRRGKSAGRN